MICESTSLLYLPSSLQAVDSRQQGNTKSICICRSKLRQQNLVHQFVFRIEPTTLAFEIESRTCALHLVARKKQAGNHTLAVRLVSHATSKVCRES